VKINFVGLGAVDYLVKPIRMNQCKDLVTKIKKKSLTPTSGSLQGLAKFQVIRELGSGASGFV
jgi:YesN/AraC family two-component response regulator